MSDIIYIVTTGEYSDYHIDSVWDTAEKAEARVSEINTPLRGSDGLIAVSELAYMEEYWLNRSIDPKVIWTVVYKPDVGEWECGDWDGTTHKLDEVEQLDEYNYRPGTFYRVKLRADNREAALKIANERIMKLIASSHK